MAYRLNFANNAVLIIVGAASLMLPVLICTMNAAWVYAQAANSPTTPKFEVASAKACKDDGRNGAPATSPGRLNTSCMTVRGLIQIAYERYAGGRFHPLDFRDFPPIEGGPKWLDTDRFEISAKADGRFSQAMMNGPMLQALIEERFKLKLHHENRIAPVYALTVAKGAPKLQALKEGTCISLDPENPPSPSPGEKLPVICGTISGRKSGPNQMMDIHGMSLDEFSKFGMGLFGRPVINKTGIAGKFDWHLEFIPDNGAADDPYGPTIFTAMQEQLGLRLVPAKGPIDVLVIDHVPMRINCAEGRPAIASPAKIYG